MATVKKIGKKLLLILSNLIIYAGAIAFAVFFFKEPGTVLFYLSSLAIPLLLGLLIWIIGKDKIPFIWIMVTIGIVGIFIGGVFADNLHNYIDAIFNETKRDQLAENKVILVMCLWIVFRGLDKLADAAEEWLEKRWKAKDKA